MKIDESNALKVACYGAGFFWLAVSACLIRDLYFKDLMAKGGWLQILFVFSGFCGTAFYALMGLPAIRSWRRLPRSRLSRTCQLLWAFSPLPAVVMAAGLIVWKLNGN